MSTTPMAEADSWMEVVRKKKKTEPNWPREMRIRIPNEKWNKILLLYY